MEQPRKTFEEVLIILSNITFMDRKFRLLTKGDGFLFQLWYMEPDSNVPGSTVPVLQRARKWYISPFSTETEIVETVFKACRTSMEHVVREHFHYKGEKVYSPHMHIDARLDLCRQAGNFDGRLPNKEE